MNESAIEASKWEWLAFFGAGQRYEVPLNTRHLLTMGKLVAKTLWRGNIEVLDSITDHAEWEQGKNFFGDVAEPTLGISSAGLHLPTVPRMPWEHIAAIILMNQASLMAQASNGYILDPPPVGNTSKVFRSDLSYFTIMMIVTADGVRVQQELVSNPSFSDVVALHPTNGGRQIGAIQTPLEPYVGPEQGVEYLFLLHLLAQKNAVTVYHAESYQKMMQTLWAIRDMN